MHVLRQTGLILATGVAVAAAAEYVVAPAGDDAASGSREAPFRTIGRAAAVMQPGDVCLVRQGTYRETVQPANTGTPEQPITFRAWPGERPVISGLDPVTGWERVGGDLWRAPMDWDLGGGNQVFLDGRPGQEARWPNKTNADPLDWEAVPFDSGSTDQFLLCQALPDRPDGHWKGAVLWVMAGAKWTSWSAIVTDYSQAERKLTFALTEVQSGAIRYMSPSERRGGFFYLVGNRDEIDHPGEWALDAAAKALYLQVPPGADPNALAVEAKRRSLAVQLDGLEHIVVEGFGVLGASLSLEASKHCRIGDLRAHWISHLRGGNTAYSLGENLGILVGGEHNTIRDSEIAYSAGNGIRLSGRRHAVINCWIHHTDTTGCYDAPIKIWGEEMLISHNTLHDTGRDCLQPPGQAHIIQYNRMFNMGRLAHDLGATYVVSADGGGTEFRYNWCHDNLAHGTRMGIYLDNFTSDYFVYRNVVWNIRGCDIRLNKPSLHNVVVNNTMLGNTGNWGRWATDWMYGCAYVNNAVTGTIQAHPQAAFVHNTFNIPTETLNHENFQHTVVGAGQGHPVPGLTGPSPAIGAYEPGDTWKAGHDFANPPQPEYRLADTPLRNLIAHGSFDWVRWRGKLGPWEPTGAKTAKIVWGPGGITSSYTTRNTIVGAGVELAGGEADGIRQTITGLRPRQEYELSAWVKTQDGAGVVLRLLEVPGVEAEAHAVAGTEWQMLTARFTTGDKADSGLVHLTKTGAGIAWVDDVGLVGVVAGMAPQLPGFAPVAAREAPRPTLPRRTAPLLAPRTDRPGVFPGEPFAVEETPGRTRAGGPPCRAWAAHADGVLMVRIEIPLEKPLTADPEPVWTKADGAEVCFAYPDENARHPTFVLHGFPNGTVRSSTEAGAPDAAAAALLRQVTFKAEVGSGRWTAEWHIPLAAVDIPGRPGLELHFNLGVFRAESKQWIQWAGTQGQTWRVRDAGRIRLAE